MIQPRAAEAADNASMPRALLKILFLGVLVVAGSVGMYVYYDYFSTARQIRDLEEKNRQLEQIVSRLTADKRVAEMLVTDQKTVDGVLQTTLLFVEYAHDQSPLPAKSFTIKGHVAHVDALVIQFERDFVKQNDPLRGHSIALFTRIYGDSQAPEDGFHIDEPGKVPDIYRGADPRLSKFERDLWTDFWKLADDPAYRLKTGVRVANGQGVWGPFDPDKLYTLSIESAGGVHITCEPIKPIYREALKRRGAVPLP